MSTTSQRLTTADIKQVLEALASEVSSKWYPFGIQLEVSVDKLDYLRKQNTSDNLASFCLVLVEWIKSGQATWEALCVALASETIGERALAEKLKTDYCTPEGIDVHEIVTN